MAGLSPQDSSAADELFEPRRFQNAAGESLPYRFLRPINEEPHRKYPLVLCLHGAGERGEDNARQLIHFARHFAKREVRQEFPAWVVVPQCPANERWVEVDWRERGCCHRPQNLSRPLRLCLEAIPALEREVAIDPRRFYVLGLSMGGFGTWDLISRFPDVFAAAAPICGGGDESLAPSFRKVPVWAFHGALDEVVSPEYSRRMIRALEAAGGHPRYTEYPEVGHDAWTPAFAESALFPWLFSQALAR